MREYVNKLQELNSKIENIWSLLDVDQMTAQMHGLEQEMQQPDFWKNQENAALVSKNHEELKKEIDTWTNLKNEAKELSELGEDLEENPEESIKAEFEEQVEKLEKQFNDLEFFMLLDGAHDKKNAIVAVHAGSGGTEAQDWAEMLLRMLTRYCEKKNWKMTFLDESRGTEAGIKSTIFRVEGRYAYGHLKSEHGTHRLVRISPFDAEKMRHTSFALIEVIPEIENHEDIKIDPNDLRIDTFMAGGHGGQSVNTTYSAVRIVHKPTGISVQCQNERSQLQNKETAMKILASKLQKLKEEEERKEKEELKGEHKSAEWGNQIRSYVLHPYKMVKDLRSRYETQDVEAILDGKLDELIEAYLKYLKSNP